MTAIGAAALAVARRRRLRDSRASAAWRCGACHEPSADVEQATAVPRLAAAVQRTV
jgi:cytochrome c553